MRFWLRALVGAIVVVGIAIAGLSYAYWDQTVQIGSTAINYVRYWSAPAGTLETEVAPTGAAAQPSTSTASAAPQAAPGGTEGDWPSYNKTLTSNRFSELSQINRTNAEKLKVLCTYDTRQYTSFNSGLLEVNGALIFVTAFDIFSIDPSTCRENWRTHEDYVPATPQEVNRGAAYLDGMLFRGTQDARVLAYDFKTGKRIWETVIGDPKKGESAPAAPIAWNGLVFIGNAGGDIKGVKGRMYALDAKTGKIVWEFYLVPKAEGDPTRGPLGASPLNASTWGNSLQGVPITGGATWTSYTLDPDTGLLYVPGGNPAPDFATDVREGSNLYSGSVVVLDAMTGAYKNHFKIVPKDWHDWDVSGAPAIIKTAGGKKVLSARPEGRPPLRLRSRHQCLALQAAGHPDGERGCAVCGRQARPLLSRLDWRRRVERSRLRSPVEPRVHRRGRMVHHRYAYADRENRQRAARPTVVRRSIDQPVLHVG